MASFDQASGTAASAPALPARTVPLQEAAGCVLAEPLRAQLNVPHAATSAMDGWAVAAPLPAQGSGGPRWRVRPEGAEGPSTLLAPLAADEAVGVVTGSPVPEGTVSVLRSEHARMQDGELRLAEQTPDLEPGRNIRPVAAEAAEGDLILDSGEQLSAAGTAAAAVAGYDTLRVVPRPRVRLILTGSEVVTTGLPGPGQVRDVFGLALPPMLGEAGAQLESMHRIDDDPAALRRLLDRQEPTLGAPDLIITTGGTAASRADTLRPVLTELEAEILISHVDMRPGHPALLARIPRDQQDSSQDESSHRGTYVLGLPGNPLAGFAALTVLGLPLIAALAGRPQLEPLQARAGAEISGAARRGRGGVRLVPARLGAGADGPLVHPLEHAQAHMMRGLAQAEVLAVVPAEGLAAGDQAECLQVPGRSDRRSQPPQGGLPKRRS